MWKPLYASKCEITERVAAAACPCESGVMPTGGIGRPLAISAFFMPEVRRARRHFRLVVAFIPGSNWVCSGDLIACDQRGIASYHADTLSARCADDLDAGSAQNAVERNRFV